jgi:UDP:flavonoid glycosyltransferase YjiC (YdhE family)
LGTIKSEDRHGTLRFFERLTEATRNKNYFLLISFQVSEDEKRSLVGNRPDIVIYDLLPQLQVLSNADLFITHGGLNSIKESINALVPMLVYPVDANYDQNGNSSRVIYHKLGLRGNIKSDSVEEIRDKVHELITNQEYRNSMIKMRQFENQYELSDLASIKQST